MNKNLKEILLSAVTLMLIGAVVTAALAGTNALTKDTIAAATEKAENEARGQVLAADSFEKAQAPDGTEYYRAVQAGETAGYVFTATVSGKSSGLTVMTGIDVTGRITGVIVTEQNETAGYVDKVTKGGLFEALVGKEAKELTLGEDVDAVSQATKTSGGIVKGVNKAIETYQAIAKTGGEG